MIYEKHLKSLTALGEELERLDGDAGVRVEGKYDGTRCFAFVTRFGDNYTVLVYSASRGTGAKKPGIRLTSSEFTNPTDTLAFLKKLAKPNVDAYLY